MQPDPIGKPHRQIGHPRHVAEKLAQLERLGLELRESQARPPETRRSGGAPSPRNSPTVRPHNRTAKRSRRTARPAAGHLPCNPCWPSAGRNTSAPGKDHLISRPLQQLEGRHRHARIKLVDVTRNEQTDSCHRDDALDSAVSPGPTERPSTLSSFVRPGSPALPDYRQNPYFTTSSAVRSPPPLLRCFQYNCDRLAGVLARLGDRTPEARTATTGPTGTGDRP